MTTLADRSDQLLDLAAHALANGRVDLVSTDDTANIFQLAVEILEPALRDRDAEIARLRRELTIARNQLELHQGIANSLAKARQLDQDAAAVTQRIREVVHAAKLSWKAVAAP